MFDQPHSVIAEITEETSRRLRQVVGEVNPAFPDQFAKPVERVPILRLKRLSVEPGGAVDGGLFAMAAPDQIRFHSNDRIPPAYLAAGHGFKHKRVFLSAGKLQHQGDRRVEIRRQPSINHLVLARLVSPRECLKIGGERHRIYIPP